MDEALLKTIRTGPSGQRNTMRRISDGSLPDDLTGFILDVDKGAWTATEIMDWDKEQGIGLPQATYAAIQQEVAFTDRLFLILAYENEDAEYPAYLYEPIVSQIQSDAQLFGMLRDLRARGAEYAAVTRLRAN